MSNSGAGADKQFSNEADADVSVIYKWNKRRKRFVRFQTLQTYCARDWEAFTINGHTYLAVANHRLGKNEISVEKCPVTFCGSRRNSIL